MEHLADTERAATRFEGYGDDDGLWLALTQQTQMLGLVGRGEAALTVAERSADVAAKTGDPWKQARSQNWIALELANGSIPVADAISRCEEVLHASYWDAIPPFGVWCALIALYAEAGRIDDSRKLTNDAIAATRRTGQILVTYLVMEHRAAAEFAAGDLRAAIRHQRSALEIRETDEDRAHTPGTVAELPACSRWTAQSRRLTNWPYAPGRQLPVLFACESLAGRLALSATHGGDLAEGLRLSNEARARTAASARPTFHAQTLEEAATVLRAASDTDRATEALSEALAIYKQKGNIVGVDRVRRRLDAEA